MLHVVLEHPNMIHMYSNGRKTLEKTDTYEGK